MIRLLLLAVVLSGCTIGAKGSELVQARGATVALAVRVDGRQQILAGELLAVEVDSLLIDSLDEFGQPYRVVRVAKGSVAEGAVYTGTSPGNDVRTLQAPTGMRRVARVRSSGESLDNRLLIQLSRFPGGLSGSLLSRLLVARGQENVGTPRDAQLLDPSR